MIFTETAILDAFVIDPEPIEDPRGAFARTFCHREFARHGIAAEFVQCNISFNAARGTLRGLHFQAPPHAEAKLVRCTSGRVFDVAVDVRRDSPTFGCWYGVELNAADRRMHFLPEGVAHGFQTLEDGSELFYQMSADFAPEAARGLRFDDPELGIAWPLPDPIMSDRDRALPDLAAVMAREPVPA